MSASARLRGVLAAGAAAALALSALVAAPATARPLDSGTFVDEWSFTDENFCDAGITVELEGVDEGRYLFNQRKPGTEPYWNARISSNVTYTNLDGDSVTEVVRLIDKDLAITPIEGGVRILVLATGNAAVYDESGKAIARNPGQVRYEVQILFNDPEDPEDDEFTFLGLVKESTGRTDDFCAAVLPILG
jgi:hypothetical protein